MVKPELPLEKIPPTAEEPWRYEYEQPVERFAQLPKDTRERLERMRKEDWEEMFEAVRFYKTAKQIGKFNFYLISGVAGLIIAVVGFGETIRTALKWFKP